MTLDANGVIQSATESVTAVFPVQKACELCGLPLNMLLADPGADPVGQSLELGQKVCIA